MAQRLGGILGAPAPIRIHGEQRDVTEHDDRRVTGQRRDIFGNKVQLLGAQVPKFLQIERVHQRDNMHAGDVEAVPAVAAGSGAEHASVFLARVVDGVVLAGHGEDVRRAEAGQHLLDLIELLGGGQVGEVTGVNDKVGYVAKAV